jgi:hypothetical protein
VYGRTFKGGVQCISGYRARLGANDSGDTAVPHTPTVGTFETESQFNARRGKAAFEVNEDRRG